MGPLEVGLLVVVAVVVVAGGAFILLTRRSNLRSWRLGVFYESEDRGPLPGSDDG